MHAALSYTSFVVDAQVTYSFFRDQTPDFDLSGIRETARTVDGETHYVIRGSVVPGYYRAHNFGAGASAALGGWVISADGGLKLTENADGTRIDVKRPGNPLRRAGGPCRLHRPAAVQRVSRPVSPPDPALRR